MIQKWAVGLDEKGNLCWGWVEPIQLWLPFPHLDFLWSNLERTEEIFFKPYLG